VSRRSGARRRPARSARGSGGTDAERNSLARDVPLRVLDPGHLLVEQLLELPAELLPEGPQRLDLAMKYARELPHAAALSALLTRSLETRDEVSALAAACVAYERTGPLWESIWRGWANKRPDKVDAVIRLFGEVA
jgi:hypothetical protein